MIFSKHKKQGAEVGRAIKKTLLIGTTACPFNKKNELLAAAINDPYVKGFVIYFSAMSIDMIFKGAFWKKKKRIEFLIECWQELGIPIKNIHEFLRVIGDPIKEGVWDKGGQYSEGKNAAALVLTSAYGILNREALQTDIIVKAQKRANEMRYFRIRNISDGFFTIRQIYQQKAFHKLLLCWDHAQLVVHMFQQ